MTGNTNGGKGEGRRGRQDRQRKRERGQCEGEGPIRTRGQHAPTHPAIQRDRHANEEGDTNTRTGGSTLQYPPFTHHATHHPRRHPTIHDGPTHHHDKGGVDRGYPTTRTPHTTAIPHTTHLAANSARHDSSTRQHCSGMSRARATPPHRAGQQHTPPPFHTPMRMDTIHSSTHPLIYSHSLMFTQSTINDDQRTMNNEQ